MANIQLAEQSKTIAARSHKEAMAMKTIAILTMLFLPATFVAVGHLKISANVILKLVDHLLHDNVQLASSIW
jgi:hypothetical protein